MCACFVLFVPLLLALVLCVIIALLQMLFCHANVQCYLCDGVVCDNAVFASVAHNFFHFIDSISHKFPFHSFFLPSYFRIHAHTHIQTHNHTYTNTYIHTTPPHHACSGLDNSPMYDGDFFDASLRIMQLYDVGFSSMFAHDTQALAFLASELGKDDVAAALKARAEQVKSDLQLLWNEELSVFANMFLWNATYPRISPTSFYPLMVSAATLPQAQAMVKAWLLSPERFCINENWPEGNTEQCYWGLPSISADDFAFKQGGYWRSFVWGPMAQLVYWSLDQYDADPLIHSAKVAMCKQMTAMFMNQWNLHRHVCENFDPKHLGPDCTGNKFYHWGALAGFITLLENGLA